MARGQSPTVDRLTQSELISKALALEPQAAPGGSASAKLAEYPHHFTMIALRKKDGGAEIHQNFADFFFILKGKATLVTGGTVVDPMTVSPARSKAPQFATVHKSPSTKAISCIFPQCSSPTSFARPW